MTDPIVIPRAEHTISRGRIDPDALKVLYRLHQHSHLAYLVGGSVRDLLLGRQPKDFDIGTSAHPYEIKRLFRNCWIIGRRFRLAHVKFGPKTIEVATFRRKVPAAEELAPQADTAPVRGPRWGAPTEIAQAVHGVHHDNTFGTPEEDAFRRDFTLNALFYDIGTFSLIDYTGGLADLRAGLIRCIGDPDERFVEDPVRMLRAVALEARLDFRIDPPLLEAIERKRLEMARSAPPRLMEEFYKILRAGVSARTFHGLRETGLLEAVVPEVQFRPSEGLWQSLSELDAYRRRLSAQSVREPPSPGFPSPSGVPSAAPALGCQSGVPSAAPALGCQSGVPAAEPSMWRPHWGPVLDAAPGGPLRGTDTLTNPILLGSLLVPLGFQAHVRQDSSIGLGSLPLARRDVDRLRQILQLQRRLLAEVTAPARVRRSLAHRSVFREALTWLEIHGDAPALVESWRAFVAESAGTHRPPHVEEREGTRPRRRRRRRRRGRFRRPPVP